MTIERTGERLAGGLKAAAQGAEKAAEATAGMTEGTAALRDRLTSTMESARAAYQRLQDGTIAAARATDDTIRDHPYETIGIAFSLGLLIGVLLARR